VSTDGTEGAGDTGDGHARRSVLTLAGLLGLLLALLAVAIGVGILRSHGDTATPATPAASASEPPATAVPAGHGRCARPPAHPFVPASLTVVGRRAAVHPVPRTPEGVMGVLPESDRTDFATDRGGVLAGAAHGRLLLNTHTWPDGSAMGNRLLAHLRVGGRLVVRGAGGTACYRVVERQEVLAADGYPGWDRRRGAPEAVVVVCSGRRLGPGDWTHRTLWFARPYFGGRPAA
jgi:hypothetical protein